MCYFKFPIDEILNSSGVNIVKEEFAMMGVPPLVDVV